ncbi:leucyl/phenylalanyl-tRNA--protein transferase [Anianabacter salinae]|uniref:leucyl/phenylalanyl-tRNA--protein transferase n=1 Tax=Anianabacter salinae TaxID=2851023 RepID=UPI00225DD844|nr:leucyl/phenylalanyl-tRNA--protein transferase [Anianabacter salinae]MBV0912331.1 leucyl/phenylalanyl-tRNA--protein transferase [Anianabacter salinae]
MVQAYRAGIFPMAESRDSDDLAWIDPHFRGVLPLDGFRISRSLARRLRRGGYRVTLDRAFDEVVIACGDRDETWINPMLFSLYRALFAQGICHSVEVWEGDDLTGGVFGLHIGAAFFGESMFSRRTDHSKIALAYLTAMLRQAGFALFDTQFLTPHLASLGGREIPRAAYRATLEQALALDAQFPDESSLPVSSVWSSGTTQRSTQTS